MSEAVFSSVSLGLSAAIAWGAADFTGGLATKRTGAFGVVIGMETVGVILLTPLAFTLGGPLSLGQDLLLACLAGLCGGLGLTLLYRALAVGKMSIAAPVSALVGAALPVLVGLVYEGLPKPTAIAGIGLALVAIFLISRLESQDNRSWLNLTQLALPLAAGVLFGLFFVLLHQGSQKSTLWPIIASRLASILFLIFFASITRQPWITDRSRWPLIGLCGLLDTGGNVFYVFAAQAGRMDIAAVLSSLYPAATVTMAWLVLKERLSTIQSIGMLAAFFAILLIVI